MRLNQDQVKLRLINVLTVIKRRKQMAGYKKKYTQSEKGKASLKKYKQTEKGRKVNQRSQRKYKETEKGRALGLKSSKKYNQSEKGKANRSKYYKETYAEVIKRKKLILNFKPN